MSVIITELAWIFTFSRYPDTELFPQGSCEHWTDVSDMGLAREYICEKLPLIQRIIEKHTVHSD